jgi:hypothetical protein
MAKKKYVAGVGPVDMTAQEEADFDASLIPSLPEAKRAMRKSLGDQRDMVEGQGVDFQAKRLPTDPVAQARLAVLHGAGLSGQVLSVRFLCLDDSYLTLSANEIKDLVVAVAVRFTAISQNERTLRQSINACTTPQQALAVDITVGWPA